ncbi:MAG: hypothetical protein J6B89_02165 [Bacilli bacterium]|nr:hypothetical protein [Bacilli bacterium]
MDGYKAFNSGLVNRYGAKFEVGKIYSVDTTSRKITYGNDGYGFHFASRPEDCFRYFDAMNDIVDITKVSALGDVQEYFDDYYGYYDLYVTSSIRIDQILTREEIINHILLCNNISRLVRFISLYKLNSDEIDFIVSMFNIDDVIKAIYYYQYNDKDVYTRKLEKYL